jgi:hypothetical protein
MAARCRSRVVSVWSLVDTNSAINLNRATAHEIHNELAGHGIWANVVSVAPNECSIEIYGPDVESAALAHIVTVVEGRSLPFEITDEGWFRLG